MRLLIAMLVTVGLVAALTFGVVVVFDLAGEQSQDPTVDVGGGGGSTTTGVVIVPAPGQVFVSGTATGIHVEGANIPDLVMPLVVVTPARGSGSGATFEQAIIDGQVSTVEWDAGRPLEMSGDGGALVLDPVTFDADAGSMVVSLDGIHGVSAAAYHLATPVAVGTAGIAEPVDSVNFDAIDATTVEFRGGCSTTLDPSAMSITGPGLLVMDGTFQLQTADGTQTVSHIELAQGEFEVQLAPAEGGYTVTATVEGDFATA